MADREWEVLLYNLSSVCGIVEMSNWVGIHVSSLRSLRSLRPPVKVFGFFGN